METFFICMKLTEAPTTFLKTARSQFPKVTAQRRCGQLSSRHRHSSAPKANGQNERMKRMTDKAERRFSREKHRRI